MAFIKYTPDPGWEEDPDSIIRIHGIHPRILRTHLAIYRATMQGESPLSLRQREMLAVVVSAHNQCHY